jgi:hypothetical protein
MFRKSALLVLVQLTGFIALECIRGYWPIQIKLNNVDLLYILSAEKQDLIQFYPQLGYPVQLLMKAGLFFLTGAFFWWALLHKQRWKKLASAIRKVFFTKSLLLNGITIPFSFTIIFALLAYFAIRYVGLDSFESQLVLTRVFLLVNIVNILLTLGVNYLEVRTRFLAFLLEPQLPYALAMTRILFFTSLVVDYLFHFNGENLGKLDRVSLPLIGWVVQNIPITPDIHFGFKIMGITSAVMVIIGLKTRVFLIFNAVVVTYVVSVPHFFGKLAHEQLIIWISWILAVSPCFDVFSLDKRSSTNFKSRKSADYGFHLKIIWLHFGLIYFFAGYFKLWKCGFDWALTDSMINQIQIEWFEHFDKPSSIRLDKFPVLAMLGGMAVIVFELAFPFLLFGKRLKWLAIVGGLAMHKFLGRLMYIAFAQLQIAYLVFFPWNWLAVRFNSGLSAITGSEHGLKWQKVTVWFPIFVLSMNFMCGVFNVNSYPFSIYPTYSEIVPDTVKYFEYKVLDPDKSHLDVWEEGKKVDFFWERYTRIEYYIIREWERTRELDTATVVQQWNRWRLEIPSLAEVDSVMVYVKKTPVSPEERDKVLNKTYLMTITPQLTE